MNPLKKKIAKVIIKQGAKEVRSRIDTPEERKQLVEKVKIPGLPPWASWAVAVLAALLLETLNSAGFDLLVAGDYAAWGDLLVKTFIAKALLMTNEGQEIDAEEEEAKS